MFRSNVLPTKRWHFKHKTGLLFLLPGGVMHASSPWTLPHPRITVAFNLAPAANARPHDPRFFNQFRFEELFSAEEMAEMEMQHEEFAMIVARPPNRYTACQQGHGPDNSKDGVCPGGHDQTASYADN